MNIVLISMVSFLFCLAHYSINGLLFRVILYCCTAVLLYLLNLLLVLVVLAAILHCDAATQGLHAQICNLVTGVYIVYFENFKRFFPQQRVHKCREKKSKKAILHIIWFRFRPDKQFYEAGNENRSQKYF